MLATTINPSTMMTARAARAPNGVVVGEPAMSQHSKYKGCVEISEQGALYYTLFRQDIGLVLES